MTILVQLPNDLVLTLTKGSDVSVRECLSAQTLSSAETDGGFAMAAELASRGLRVLSLSYKVHSYGLYRYGLCRHGLYTLTLWHVYLWPM